MTEARSNQRCIWRQWSHFLTFRKKKGKNFQKSRSHPHINEDTLNCQKHKHQLVLVWWCWVLGVGVMWCCAVMFPEEGILLTACLQTVRRKTFAPAVPPLSTIHFIQYSYPFCLFEETTGHFRIDSWLYQDEMLNGQVGWRGAVSIAFCSLMGKVHLDPTGRPWGCHREHFSWGGGSKCQTCITWKVLHRF